MKYRLVEQSLIDDIKALERTLRTQTHELLDAHAKNLEDIAQLKRYLRLALAHLQLGDAVPQSVKAQFVVDGLKVLDSTGMGV